MFTGTTGGVTYKIVAQVIGITSSVGGNGLTLGLTLGATSESPEVAIAANSVGQFTGTITVGSTAAGQAGLTASSIDWKYRSNFSTDLPATSIDASDRGATNDLIHVAVIDEHGLISGTKGDVLEVFDGVSKASNVKDTFGNNLFVQQRIRNDSAQYS